MRLVPLLVLFAGVGSDVRAQSASDTAWQLALRLSQVNRNMRQALANQPDYTCLATFDRYRWMINEPAERKIDTVRVEVAFVGGHELYSWPGEGKFSDVPLSSMVGVGMMGDGDFAVHAHNVFVSDSGVKTFLGEEQIDGRKLWHWEYKISVYQSGWTIRESNTQQVVGIAGSFWVDAQTLDQVKIDSHATDFLSSFPLQAASSAVEYARVHIAEQDVLLPVHGELKTTTHEGHESRNRVEYSNCRQYTGSSTISFAEPVERAAPAPATSRKEERIRAGLALHIRLSNDLNVAQAGVGDPVEATLTEALRDGRKEIAPKGATVHGRLRLLRQDSADGQKFVEVGVALEDLEFPGHLEHFSATLRSFDSLVPGVSMELITPRRAVENSLKQQRITPANLPGAGVFFVVGPRQGVPKGTLMTWRTQ